MKAIFSLRVSAMQWSNPHLNAEVLELLRAHSEIGEVAFFTQHTHSPLPLKVIQERAGVLRDVLPRYRAIGVRAGINHLSTIGHLNENLENSLREPWQRLVDSSGKIAGGSFCLSDERVREYVRESYRALAKAQPDFIWIDDDVRLETHMPLGSACFCELCLAKWSEETGKEWTRQSLVASFSEGASEEKLVRRSAWLEHNRSYVADGIRLIRQTVDEINPDLSLGFMTTALPYSGAAFERWARELSGERGLENLPAKWRPGGGFYSDERMAELSSKAHSVGFQIAPVPAEVTDIQYELESFPYFSLRKSRAAFGAEIAAAIGAGCSGAALNIMGTTADPIGEFHSYFQHLQKCAPFFNRAVETFGRSACEGIGVARNMNTSAATNPDGAWPGDNSWANGISPDEWSEIGLPFSYGESGRRVTIVAGETASQWSRAEWLEMLAGGVVLDGVALGYLNAVGLLEYSGFAVAGTKERDTLEKFTNDELNGKFAGWQRDCRPSFWPETSFVFEPTQKGSRVLSELIDFKPQSFGATSGVYENKLGGRVAVLGYYPWRMVQSLAKTEQLKSLCRWLSRDTVPAFIESYSRAAIWCRRDADNRPAFLVLNASLDAQDISVRVLNAPQKLQCVRMDGSEETLSRGNGKTYSSFTISNLGAWQAALLTAE